MSLFDKIRKQFKTTIPQDYELEFDICMKCGRRMPDRKYSTLKVHEQTAHPISKKELRNALVYKHPILTLIIMMFVALTGLELILPLVKDQADDVSYYISTEIQHETALDPKSLVLCGDRITKLEQDIHAQKEFGVNNVNEMNDLIKNCNVRIISYQYGDNIIVSEDYDPNKKLD